MIGFVYLWGFLLIGICLAAVVFLGLLWLLGAALESFERRYHNRVKLTDRRK